MPSVTPDGASLPRRARLNWMGLATWCFFLTALMPVTSVSAAVALSLAPWVRAQWAKTIPRRARPALVSRSLLISVLVMLTQLLAVSYTHLRAHETRHDL